MNQSRSPATVLNMSDAEGAPSNLVRLMASVPRDRAFKLAELGFLQIFPAAKTKRTRLFYISVGFDAGLEVDLHAIYRRHDVSGLGFGAAPAFGAVESFLTTQLDVASGASAAARFDCLSILGCEAARHVIEMIADDRFRPGLIHCADRASFDDWAEVREILGARGYTCVGELESAEIFIDSPLFDAPDARPMISTFDVFDTLIARRCFEPWRIFEKVGELTGLADFVEQRRAAEGRVIETAYVFDDIYNELAAHYGWSPDKRREVQALEMTCELDAVMPIKENMARVRDGDLLVSDMYLSEAQIRSLVEKAGLTAKVGLFVASHGKSSGHVWPLIDAQFQVKKHLGDNPHADVAMPEQFGFKTGLTRASDVNLVERTLLQSGLRGLAMLCREARLATWHDDPAVRPLQAVQVSVNLPLLVLASVAVARRAVALGKTSIAFCSRDCNLWLPLFDKIQAKLGLSLESRYFLTSRLSRKKGSDAYLAYARTHIGPDTLVVDLCGTGWSMANLAERLGMSALDLFLIDHCPPLDTFEQTKATPKTCVIHKLFDKRPNANNIVLELANMADHDMVVDMRAIGPTFVPVFAPNPLSVAESMAVQEQRKCFLASLDLVDRHALQDVFDLDEPSIAFLASSLYEYMSKQTDCFQIFAQNFLSENEMIVRELTS